MNIRLNALLLVPVFATSPVLAANDDTTQLEPLVVTATRIPQPLSKIGRSITVITAEDIAARQVFTLSDVLRSVPGLDVVQTGGLGKTTSLFLRGANSNHTLVLIDGIEVNDTASPGAAFDFANLTVDNIERVEILRGPQSILYGSDAIGGVINIVTKLGKGKPGASLSAEGGSFSTWKLGGNSAGSLDSVSYSISASHLKSGGFSAADDRLGNQEDDSYKNTTVSARMGWQALDNLNLDVAARFHHSETDIDDCGGPNCDDPNNRQEGDQIFVRGQGKLGLFDDFWQQTLRLSYSRTERRNRDQLEPGDQFALDSNFRGEKFKLDWQNNLNLTSWDTLVFGITTETEWFDTNEIDTKSATTKGYYGQNQIEIWDRFITTAGVRYDDHNRAGGKVTWGVSQAVLIPETNTKLHASYGKGFKAPSLFQLLAPAGQFGPIGNPDLKPERSRGWDVGIDQSFWEDKILLGATYFHNQFTNLIDFEFGTGYVNTAAARSVGVESYVEIQPLDILTLRGSYTFTNTEDNQENALFNRPRHKGSFDADLAILENGHLHLNVLTVGSRRFSSFSVKQKLPTYVVVNLAGSYQILPNFTVFGRINNLLDKEYEEVPGYGASRVAGFGGFRLSF
ncbi:MAG: hypothetical protein AXA67_10980 [Methylothermaceae bacteria B42]|nr:MAG: hypothetical protein AXA67_10980 [Methylothermaceae bacteria B42]HHJ38998.1 TonB-dependent receptor [Methylothermaceae bacterium]